ncbi:unnamed protein product [Prunus armeniaca]
MSMTFTIWARLSNFLVGLQGSTFSAALPTRRVGGLHLRGIFCNLATRIGYSRTSSRAPFFTVRIVRIIKLTSLGA